MVWRKSSYSNPNGECVEVDDSRRAKSSCSAGAGECLEWRTSSHSGYNGACVEAAGDWVKSSLSKANGNCVEEAPCACGGALVRDSRDPDGPVLRFSPQAWREFLAGLIRLA